MALFPAFHSASSAEISLKTIKVSVSVVSLLPAPMFIAIDAGAFKKYGMDVRYIVTGARPIVALVGGAVHFARAGGQKSATEENKCTGIDAGVPVAELPS